MHSERRISEQQHLAWFEKEHLRILGFQLCGSGELEIKRGFCLLYYGDCVFNTVPFSFPTPHFGIIIMLLSFVFFKSYLFWWLMTWSPFWSYHRVTLLYRSCQLNSYNISKMPWTCIFGKASNSWLSPWHTEHVSCPGKHRYCVLSLPVSFNLFSLAGACSQWATWADEIGECHKFS